MIFYFKYIYIERDLKTVLFQAPRHLSDFWLWYKALNYVCVTVFEIIFVFLKDLKIATLWQEYVYQKI